MPTHGGPPTEALAVTRVLLADDHRAARQAVRALLDPEPWIEVVGEAADGLDAVRMAEELQPDVVITDIVMPELSGIEATRAILAANPRARVLALSLFGDREFVEASLAAGASAYIRKDEARQRLIETLRDLAR